MDTIIPKGLQVVRPTQDDFIKGSFFTLPFENRMPKGDWSAHLPTYEPQKFKYDTNECSQISAINDVAIQCNFLYRTGKMSVEAFNWFSSNGYIDANGLFAFSERFTGILSGTSINGNNQWNAWTCMSRYGLLPRKDLMYTMEESNKFNSQAEMCTDYYNPAVITEAMRAKALQALRYLQIQYQWLWNDVVTCPVGLIPKALQQSPIQIGTPVCFDWNGNKITNCGKTTVDHATTLYKSNSDQSWGILDHYHPEFKGLPLNYHMPIITQGIVSLVPVVDKNFKYMFLTDLQYGDSNDEVRMLQTALSHLGYLEPRYITGNFLDRTSAALLNFQVDNKVLWSFLLYLYKGHYFSTYSRKAMNLIFNK